LASKLRNRTCINPTPLQQINKWEERKEKEEKREKREKKEEEEITFECEQGAKVVPVHAFVIVRIDLLFCTYK
jgi:hypothetical protein